MVVGPHLGLEQRGHADDDGTEDGDDDAEEAPPMHPRRVSTDVHGYAERNESLARTSEVASMDVGVLLLRLVIGLFFIGHGAQKLFGWFGGHGLEGTGGFFQSLGYRPGKPFAAIAGVSEFFGGLLLALGIFTPFAAAAIIGVMFNAVAAVHGQKGPWVTNGGWEYNAVLSTTAAAIAFMGPGSASLDSALGLYADGVAWGVAAVAMGVVTGLITDVYRRAALRSPRLARGRDVHATA